jgi:hypothetical protein
MTKNEFEYIKRAVEAIEAGQLNKRSEVKVLRTISQITEKSAKNLERKIGDKLVDKLVA